MDATSPWMMLWPVVGWAVWIAGVLLVVRAVWGARPKAACCRRCGHELPDRVPVTCPECGCEASSRRTLFARRRSVRVVAAGLVVMFAGRSVWAVPQVMDYGWRRLVPSSVLVFITPLWTRAWLQFGGSWCGDPPPPAPLMDDFLERAAEGRLWRWQTWTHAHLIATAAWAMDLPVDLDEDEARATAGDGQWRAIPIGDIARHLEQFDFDPWPREAIGFFLSLCESVDEERWCDWDTRDARMKYLADDVLVAAPVDVLARFEVMVAAMRAAINEPAEWDDETGPESVAPSPPRILLLLHRASPDGESRYVAFYRVADLLVHTDEDREYSAGDRFKAQFGVLLDANGWMDMGGERMRTEGYVIGDILVLRTTRAVHVEAESVLAEMRSR